MSVERESEPEALGMAGRAEPGGEEVGCKEPSGHIGAFREWKHALSSLDIKAYICTDPHWAPALGLLLPLPLKPAMRWPVDSHTASAVMAEPLTAQSSDKSFAVTWKEPSEKSLPAPMLLSQPHHVTIKSNGAKSQE